MINPYAQAPRFECSGRLLTVARLPLPPLPTEMYVAVHHEPGGGVGSSILSTLERRELGQAMMNYWRAWGGVS